MPLAYAGSSRCSVKSSLPSRSSTRRIRSSWMLRMRPRADYYATQTPTAADCLLVIEVADTSAEFDRQIKAPRYALGGVRELWLVDLEREVVVVYHDPTG